MRGTNVVEIGSGNAVECARRVLTALQSGDAHILKRELWRAKRVCERAASDKGLAGEQAELLDAIVDSLSISMSGYAPYGETEISLLGDLARTA